MYCMDLSQRRLRNQYINGSRLEDPAEVVRALGAVQAQDYYSALWAIGLRLHGGCEARVAGDRRAAHRADVADARHLAFRGGRGCSLADRAIGPANPATELRPLAPGFR